MDNLQSYTAADNFPAKVLGHGNLQKWLSTSRKILPIHVQFLPTNKCNLSCDFCSCSNEDRSIEMSMADVNKAVHILSSLGTEAVTITGGGEPLTHPNIDSILQRFHSSNIEIGLVTNGTLIENLKSIDYLTWCRISSGDLRSFPIEYQEKLSRVISSHKGVDWAFSHVASDSPNYDTMISLIEFANSHRFTHVRIVADLTMAEKVDMAGIDSRLQNEVDCSRVIFQARNEPSSGGDCYICYLKPLISADCKVYACCGVQYAIESRKERSMPDELCLGSVSDLPEIFNRSNIPFDGSICNKCYYSGYNTLLKLMLTSTEHSKFV